tara:strand:+ start:279 stop:1538 length:1260 start_codon:yes stop_codon:yes gene_type:complete
MSFYSDDNVKTRYLDPKIYVPGVEGGGRCTFELDQNEVAYLPNLRLTNIGVTIAAQTNYNALVGALSIIRNIRLMDGKVELCSQNVFRFHRGFVNINKPNSVCEAVSSKLECSAVGFTQDGLNYKVGRIAKVLPADTLASTTNTAWLDLREVFPMLNSISHLPTAVFNNLRLEIELDSTRQNQVTMSEIQAQTTLRPVLAVDVLENPNIVDKMNRGLNGASWLEVEHDQFLIPATADNGGAGDQGVVQNVNVKLNGFNNKRLERLLIVKAIGNAVTAQAGGVVGLGMYASQACFRQSLQYRVNGRNVLPAMDTSGNNRRLAQIVDNFGDCFAYIGSNQYGGDNTAELNDARNLLGNLDYMGCYIGEYINDLQLIYDRTGLEDTTAKRATTDQLVAHVYGETRKILQLQPGGQYRIAYAQ